MRLRPALLAPVLTIACATACGTAPAPPPTHFDGTVVTVDHFRIFADGSRWKAGFQLADGSVIKLNALGDVDDFVLKAPVGTHLRFTAYPAVTIDLDWSDVQVVRAATTLPTRPQ